ncbi:helix-turn-helix transcriptional regulator [Gimesia maris]|jgi:predicted ArsR family transcriptional regulator|uniref:Transcriptional regulator n=2 Tax=Gimesia maris TaxID=122 RepID=A0A3D3RBZ6_9PLAN|nr:hypothetical protein [Gimesia maris]MAC55345.1 transcriptional regulator [Gimesia sp.]EDL60011.1 hypothetical protein PM8797T_18094 [Gimesia maris DSM 8797]QDT77743.1 hypothetical protein Mal35_11710 [Gimesia maris]QDU13406.1 hypothetical protein CA11_11890 [Gimesia maris]QEG15333.1 hypothetical protein GmarT_11730 [Gimesia maris]|tara:strand:+ start:105414 stop:106037 length:624 start_codon:yes stop_codon:yes gene_type:complete
MRVSIDENDRSFLLGLNRLKSATIHEICEQEGVTATAVRQRLVRLQGLELIERTQVKEGRGRPHYTYSVTSLGMRLLGDNYAELANILWEELKGIDDEDLRCRLAARIQTALVQQYGRNVDAPSLQGRMEQLKQALEERGFVVELDHTGPLPILREHNCPYHDIASGDASICELEQRVFERVLGTKMNLSECCLDGHHCCEFEAHIS